MKVKFWTYDPYAPVTCASSQMEEAFYADNVEAAHKLQVELINKGRHVSDIYAANHKGGDDPVAFRAVAFKREGFPGL